MSTKLQELTDKLYQEGLSRGKEEGERLLAEARENAAKIVEDARNEAAKILEKAGKDSEDLKKKVDSDLKMAASQCLQATKKDIENIIVRTVATDKVDAALKDSAFLKEIIRTVAGKFSAQEACDLEVILPDSLKNELEPWVSGELAKAAGKEIKAEFSKKVAGGFTIGPKDGGYFVDLTDESFDKLIAEYIRPVTRKLLFGE